MISQGSIYLIVRDFEESVQFYKLLLERDVTEQNMNRFAIFNINGLCLSIMNGYFDSEHPDKVTTKGKVYKEYDDCVSIAEMQNTGKVVINLSTNDLKKEYADTLNYNKELYLIIQDIYYILYIIYKSL